MVTLIELVIFNFVPCLILLGGLCYLLPRYVELDVPLPSQHENVLAGEEELGLDSWALLAQESILLDLVEALPLRVDGCNPRNVETHLIMDVSVSVVLAAEIRDGLNTETVVEIPDEETMILVEDIYDDFLSSLVTDVLSTPEEFPPGSDESTFFLPTTWEEEVSLNEFCHAATELNVYAPWGNNERVEA